MKNWKKIMAGLCVAAMTGSMAMPVWAEEEDAGIEDISDAILGLWQDSVGDIYGFYADNSFFGQWIEEGEDVVGGYSLMTDGDVTALGIDFNTGDEPAAFYVTANTDENKLELVSEDGTVETDLVPYVGTGDEEYYNEVYQLMGDNLTMCYMGTTEAGETFVYSGNDDGSFCAVLVIDENDDYASFIGVGTVDEESDTITIVDEASELALTFGVTANDDGTVVLDLGDLGSATLEEAVIANAVQALKYCVENGTPVN